MVSYSKRKDVKSRGMKTPRRNFLFLRGYRIVCVISIALMIAKQGTTLAQIPPEQNLHDTILQGIDLTLRQEYPEARALFQSVIKNYPDNPAGYLYLAGHDAGRIFRL